LGYLNNSQAQKLVEFRISPCHKDCFILSDIISHDIINDTLNIELGVNLNCCGNYAGEIKYYSDTLNLISKNKPNKKGEVIACDCNCYYTLKYKVLNIKSLPKVILFNNQTIEMNRKEAGWSEWIETNDYEQEGTNTNHVRQERINEGLPSGNWFYLPYTDSTIIKKSVFLYSQTCASYAYQISYDRNNPDSIRFIGYNEQATLPLIKKDEITYRAGDTVQHWVLKFNADYTQLKEFMDSKYSSKADPNAYKFILAEKEITSPSRHFVSNILKGTYKSGSMRIELTDNLIEKDPFTDYYEVNGFNGFRTYSIAINFWEMIPQMDLIYFYDKKAMQRIITGRLRMMN